MALLVSLVGVLIAAFGVLGIVQPERLPALVRGLAAGRLLWVAVALRLGLGVIFVIAAPSCSYPWFVEFVGWLAIAAALALPVVGAQRLAALVDWWAGMGRGFTRALSLGTLWFGVALVVASSP